MATTPNNSVGSSRFTDRMFIRCPASLPPAIDKAAAQNLMTASEYVRRSVIERLRADGVDPNLIRSRAPVILAAEAEA
jgi:hypothetical protein